ncbi:MAG: hypothetical protein B6A08_10475 [Sorangiineae bacterium NIC37A_2]|jgi:MYXO-CTERM domain-containing protein|nr:MAG: hypothetical protein B6A08_10475 [Sorangiineae bacterium NIC37A_2]
MTKKSLAQGLRSLTFALLWSEQSFAYCRTTTCEPSWSCAQHPEDCCIRDDNGCDTNGKPIAWPSSCVSFAVQKDGSLKRHISADDLTALIEEAFAAWTSSTCSDGSTPSLRVENYGMAECGVSEYNRCTGNANIWMFRDRNWTGSDAGGSGSGFDSSALAVTTVNFSVQSGLLYDADVELNSDQAHFTLPNQAPIIDLKSIITHEAGHFLGFDHSPNEDATMYFAYQPGETHARTLEPDDQAAICAAYPRDRELPGGESCEPRRGYSAECHPEDDDIKDACNGVGSGAGCQTATGGPGAPSGLGLLLGLAGIFGLSGRLIRRRV